MMHYHASSTAPFSRGRCVAVLYWPWQNERLSVGDVARGSHLKHDRASETAW